VEFSVECNGVRRREIAKILFLFAQLQKHHGALKQARYAD
jgi:hypothetical protein